MPAPKHRRKNRSTQKPKAVGKGVGKTAAKPGAKSRRKKSCLQFLKRFPRLWPSVRWRKRIVRAFKRAPFAIRIMLALVLSAALAVAVNWGYQVVRKPSELFFPVSNTLSKTPAETWETYGPIFRRHSTAAITPDFLAALAQIEGSGNPIIRTYWRFSLSKKPFDIYRPASSAVGMYQITDGTFGEARRYCIRDHRVITDGPWNDVRSCWFNDFYARTVPSNAVELTSAYLDVNVSRSLSRYGLTNASTQQKQELAALIHLCGAGAGNQYARRGLRLAPGQTCGDHPAAQYIARMNAAKAIFRRLAASS